MSQRGRLRYCRGLAGAVLLALFAVSPSVATSETKAASDFSAFDLSGAEHRLSELRGSVTIVTLWATWCFPCRYEMPLLERVYRKLQGRGLRVVAVAVDDKLDAVKRYQADKNFSFDVLFDPTGISKAALGVRGVPTTFVMSSNHRFLPMRDPISGEQLTLIDNPLSWERPEMVEQLEALLSQRETAQ
ncbi:MAG: TlpA disulfide reductase family protein [Pseudomonadota bacterium]